jgi:hypothetical protein
VKQNLVSLAVGLILLVAPAQADASTVSLTTSDAICTTDLTSNLSGSQLISLLEGSCGWDVNATSLDLLYKSNVSGGESGLFASSYDTTFSNTTSDPSDALIQYVSGSYINCIECYLIVKDGNNSPAQYVFSLTAIWDGTSNLDLTGFWPNQGAISNVAIWGKAMSVPEPATLLLAGLGIATMALLRRRSATTLN